MFNFQFTFCFVICNIFLCILYYFPFSRFCQNNYFSKENYMKFYYTDDFSTVVKFYCSSVMKYVGPKARKDEEVFIGNSFYHVTKNNFCSTFFKIFFKYGKVKYFLFFIILKLSFMDAYTKASGIRL